MSFSISSVQARDLRVVRVVFDDDVPQVDPTAAGDALNPANYTITATAAQGGLVPTADVEVESVAAVDSTTVDLTTDTDLSPGRPYQLEAANLTGLDPDPDTDDFTAFTPAVPEGRSFAIADMIPKKNWREDTSGDLARFVACLQDSLTVLMATIDRWVDIIDPERAPENFIDSMLVDMGNPFQFADLSLVDKRRLLLDLITIYKLKGTVVGIRAAINFFTGLDVDIIAYGGRNNVHLGPTNTDGHLGPTGITWIIGSEDSPCQLLLKIGVPYAASNWDATEEQRTRIEAVVEYMKPANLVLQTILCPRLPAPKNMVLSTGVSGQFTVTWAAVTGANGYHVYWSYSPGVTYRNGTQVSVPAGLTTDIVATGGRRVYCVVTAIDDGSAGDEGSTPDDGVASDEATIVVAA